MFTHWVGFQTENLNFHLCTSMCCKPNISKGLRKSSQIFCQLPFPNLNALPLLINLFLLSLAFCDICIRPNVSVDFVLSFSLRFSAPTNPVHVVGTHTQLLYLSCYLRYRSFRMFPNSSNIFSFWLSSEHMCMRAHN